jgi:hypothetical protein
MAIKYQGAGQLAVYVDKILCRYGVQMAAVLSNRVINRTLIHPAPLRHLWKGAQRQGTGISCAGSDRASELPFSGNASLSAARCHRELVGPWVVLDGVSSFSITNKHR